ncbi:MAG TPA: cyclic nucleotide-binding domain-containing protein [Clostridia bacterium]|nr:cyclic nucleotide-binding domain-containing protein [Clostridia bacterium]
MPVKSTPLPFLANEELRDQLIAIGTPVTASKSEVLFRRGDAGRGVFVVVDGKVLLTAGEGPLAVHRVCRAGCILGLPATMRERPYSLTAECMQTTTLAHVSGADFHELLRKNPLHALQVVHMLADEVGTLRRAAFKTKIPAAVKKAAVKAAARKPCKK